MDNKEHNIEKIRLYRFALMGGFGKFMENEEKLKRDNVRDELYAGSTALLNEYIDDKITATKMWEEISKIEQRLFSAVEAESEDEEV